MLPPNLASEAKLQLTGQFSLQVQHGHDIAVPAYDQLQKLHNVDLEDARVSADDSQESQPRPPRCLMLTVSDGVQTVEAMEYEPISCLPDVISPGCKV